MDKLIHASIFWILAVLWINALKNQTNIRLSSIQVLAFSVLFSILYGGLMEIMQATVFSDRSCEWNDFIANSIGALFAGYYHQPKIGYRLGILK
ncbi:MAG: VanZ family protein [Bacteroidia bacterium]|nr:VanZ family protein [Bacteroidia bacterium]